MARSAPVRIGALASTLGALAAVALLLGSGCLTLAPRTNAGADLPARASHRAAAGQDPPVISEDPDALIVGDSFTEGYGSSRPDLSWAHLAGATLGWNVTIDGVGGTGFTKDTATDGRVGMDFRSRVLAHKDSGATFDVVVLQGGLNDWFVDGDTEAAKVRASVRTARAAWPDAVIMVFGPAEPIAGGYHLQNADRIRLAAGAAGATYIEPNGHEPWIDAANSPMLDFGDGLHLNDAGYGYLAARFVDAVRTQTL